MIHQSPSIRQKCKLEVGTQSMTLLASILQGDRTDLDLIQLTLETLANVMTYEVGNDEGIDSSLIVLN